MVERRLTLKTSRLFYANCVLESPENHIPSAATSGLRAILTILIVVVGYFMSLWRIIRSNRGNRVVECGSIALMVSLLMVVLIRFPNLPAWVLPSLGLLLLVLCLLTIFFLLASGLQAIRGRKSSVETDTAHDVSGLDYEPRNTREKWLFRMVYWGTSLLVAFIWWEYVKHDEEHRHRLLCASYNATSSTNPATPSEIRIYAT